MQQKLILTALAICLFNAYSICSDTSKWPVAGEDIYNTSLHLYDPEEPHILATLWISTRSAQEDPVIFTRQLLAQLAHTDSVCDAFRTSLENNNNVVHAQLAMHITDTEEKLRAWGWVKGSEIFTHQE